MTQKPEIQYVGQFYVYGSEARQAAPKELPRKIRFPLPEKRLQAERMIYVDPVALCAMVVAVVMLVAMAIGALQIRATWYEYNRMERYLISLQKENVTLERTYKDSYDLEEIRASALAMGMVPAEEAPVVPVLVTMPEPPQEETIWQQVCWFVKGLFA